MGKIIEWWSRGACRSIIISNFVFIEMGTMVKLFYLKVIQLANSRIKSWNCQTLRISCISPVEIITQELSNMVDYLFLVRIQCFALSLQD